MGVTRSILNRLFLLAWPQRTANAALREAIDRALREASEELAKKALSYCDRALRDHRRAMLPQPKPDEPLLAQLQKLYDMFGGDDGRLLGNFWFYHNWREEFDVHPNDDSCCVAKFSIDHYTKYRRPTALVGLPERGVVIAFGDEVMWGEYQFVVFSDAFELVDRMKELSAPRKVEVLKDGTWKVIEKE